VTIPPVAAVPRPPECNLSELGELGIEAVDLLVARYTERAERLRVEHARQTELLGRFSDADRADRLAAVRALTTDVDAALPEQVNRIELQVELVDASYTVDSLRETLSLSAPGLVKAIREHRKPFARRARELERTAALELLEALEALDEKLDRFHHAHSLGEQGRYWTGGFGPIDQEALLSAYDLAGWLPYEPARSGPVCIEPALEAIKAAVAACAAEDPVVEPPGPPAELDRPDEEFVPMPAGIVGQPGPGRIAS
jgi:hypothetical protein